MGKHTKLDGDHQGPYVPDALVPPKKERPAAHKTTTIVMACECKLNFRAATPKVGEKVWCFKHDDYQERVA